MKVIATRIRAGKEGNRMREFRRRFGPGVGLSAAKWMLEVGAFFLRTETELLLKSRRVVPGRLLEAGYRFRFPNVGSALDDLAAPKRGALAVTGG